ncbi:MAG TPA: hypothetical protein VG755_29010 [Nannocystaceae bacterium]|nr:hypothetical protein [Nannocystaceae bacterium]
MAFAVAACSFDSAGVGSGDGTSGSATTGTSGSEASTLPTTSTTVGTSSTDATLTGVDATTEPDTSTSGAGTSSSSGASSDDESSSSGESGGGPPTFGPFDDAVPVAELNSEFFDDDPTLRGDLLEIYFASLRGGGVGGEEIWRAERNSVAEDWGDPEIMSGLNSIGQDGWPELSHDGLWLSFGSDRFGGEGSFDIYVVGRADFDSPWSLPFRVDELSSFDPEASAVMSADMLEVMLASPIPTGDDILRATRDDVLAPFGALTPVDELNTNGRDTVPFIDLLGTRVLFASDRMGDMAIWTATRELGMAFDEPEQVLDLDEPGRQEDDPWWAPDGSVIYFARESLAGDLDIYVAHQSAP